LKTIYVLLFFLFLLLFSVGVHAATLTLRPDGAGDRNDFSGTYADVDEAVADEDATKIRSFNNGAYAYAIFNIENHTTEDSVISSVKVYVRAKTSLVDDFKILVRPTGSYYSDQKHATTSYVDYDYTWSTNPATGIEWNWTEIDDLQIGVLDQTVGVTDFRVTQMYAVVTYIASPSPVTNLTWSISSTGQNANLTMNWTKGLESNYTLIRKSADEYPTNVSDGTLVYNSTGNGTYDADLEEPYYYTFWAYNNTTNLYSTPMYLDWAASWINVYNESNPSQNLTCWYVEISNEDGSEVYVSTCNNNSLVINVSDLPTGDVTFVFNCTGYKQRSYQFVIAADETISFDAYLPPVTDTTGDGTDTTELYRIRVIDNYAYPVSGAYVVMKHYINTSDTYETVGNQTTDGYGETDFYLLPNTYYKIFVYKSGYETAIVNYLTDPTFYGANYPKIVQLNYSADTTPDYDFWDICIFNATWYTNNSLKIVFIDSLSETTSADFSTFEVYNDSIASNATNSTSDSSFWYF